MFDVKYIYNEKNKIIYKLPISDNATGEKFLIISPSDDEEAFGIFLQYLNGVTSRIKRFESLEQIAEVHSAFFNLLLKNIDAVKIINAYDNLEVVRYLVIDKESFYKYILPCMERI